MTASPIQFDPIRLPPEAEALRAEVHKFLRDEIEAGAFDPMGGGESFIQFIEIDIFRRHTTALEDFPGNVGWAGQHNAGLSANRGKALDACARGQAECLAHFLGA